MSHESTVEGDDRGQTSQNEEDGVQGSGDLRIAASSGEYRIAANVSGDTRIADSSGEQRIAAEISGEAQQEQPRIADSTLALKSVDTTGYKRDGGRR